LARPSPTKSGHARRWRPRPCSSRAGLRPRRRRGQEPVRLGHGEWQGRRVLTYCTNAILAHKEVASLQIVQIPPELNVAADYGMIALKDAPVPATLLARFILGEEGQMILVKHGFGPGNGVRK
jgi:hypothetical protein